MLQIRHLVKPMKAGDKLVDHARPMSDILQALTKMKADMERLQREKDERRVEEVED